MGERPIGFVPDGFVPDAPPPTSGALDAAKRFVMGFAHNVDPRPALKLVYDGANALGGMLSGDLSRGDAFADDLKGLGQAQLEQFKKGYEAYKAGRFSEAAGHTLAGALPLVGPAAAAAGETIGSGDFAGGAGQIAGLAAGAKAPAIVARVLPKSIGVKGLGGPVDPVAAAAVAEGRAQGVPLDAATATGRPIVATLQKAISDSIGGAGTAERFQAAQAKGLATVGEQLAAKANPGGGAMTPESAGQAAIDAVGKVVADHGAVADAAYGKLRAIEARRPIPVDLTKVKAALEPLYRTLAVGADIAPLQGAKAAATRALARILEGPDIASASEVDSALSDLKALQRDAADTPGAAAANRAVAQVHNALLREVAKAGPDALKALNEGRAATTAKYAAIEVRDFLQGNTSEPVQAYGRTVAANDTNIARVRELAQTVPAEMPKIGRAFLDDVMGQATADGGFQHAARVASRWEKLGAETKALMFKDPAHITALDNFFRLAEKITKNENPSGSGKIVNLKNFWNPMQLLSAVPMAALSKLFYTEQGVRLLTDGLHVPMQSPAAIAAYTARLSAAVKNLGGALDPAMAEERREPMPPTIGRR